MSQCDAQSLSNLVWAFATVFIHTPLVASIALAAQRALQSFAAQEPLRPFESIVSKAFLRLANTVWAFARLLFIDKALCDAMSQMCISKIGQFVSQKLA